MKEAKGHILYGMVVGTPEDLQALQPRMVAEGRASSELGSWATLVGVGVPFVNQASCSLCFLYCSGHLPSQPPIPTPWENCTPIHLHEGVGNLKCYFFQAHLHLNSGFQEKVVFLKCSFKL